MKVLTKSRFKLGLECPNKLFYTKKDEYINKKVNDPFLEALAQGGFQVEELARLHYPNGVLIEGNDWDYELLWEQTRSLLAQKNVIIYEAAFLTDGLFVRTDILVKRGNHIELIEVKAKSFDPMDNYVFIGKRGGLISGWKPYLFDIAFQKYVIQHCFPLWNIDSYMMMADKTKTSSIDGLNQLFRISNDSGNRTGIIKVIDTKEDAGASVLGMKNVNDVIIDIENNKHQYHDGLTFQDAINRFKQHFQEDKYMNWPTSFSACRDCEFKATVEEEMHGYKSGFKECYVRQHNWGSNEFEKPKIFEVRNFQKGKKLFENGIFFMETLTKEHIDYKEAADGLSLTARQWLQIQKEINADQEIYVNKEGLSNEIKSWDYPLHFIDFETSSVALPFNRGRRPYEQIAFQFSHHIYHEDGIIEHATEYINVKAGYFPNFEFIRKLKEALDNDKGTILRYSNHENTILNAIYEQLVESDEYDHDILIKFIQSISHSKRGSAVKWKGDRDMVDLWAVLKKYYYNPLTKGSNSIKDVLPAVLSSSSFLQKKYVQKLKDIRVTSKNFSNNHIWLNFDNGKVISPYDKLPSVFEGWTEEAIKLTLSEIEDVAHGGAALIAYCKLQYTDMTQAEVEALTKALLKYCELDTLAMIMIFEHFKDLVNS